MLDTAVSPEPTRGQHSSLESGLMAGQLIVNWAGDREDLSGINLQLVRTIDDHPDAIVIQLPLGYKIVSDPTSALQRAIQDESGQVVATLRSHAIGGRAILRIV